MSRRSENQQSGFTMIEAAIVILIIGMIVAFATPRITTAMSEYRLTSAVRQVKDLVQRAKTQAASENRRVTLRADTSARRIGLVVYDNAGVEVRTDYVPLPQGISFVLPANVTAPAPGTPISRAVSFPAMAGSTTIFEQDFNSRGFPAVAAGAINALYIGNNRTFFAVTITSVGGVGSWVWQKTKWVSTKSANSSDH
jgi:prepilin-type N-terminal cleavage/methylation domain-containing protein